MISRFVKWSIDGLIGSGPETPQAQELSAVAKTTGTAGTAETAGNGVRVAMLRRWHRWRKRRDFTRRRRPQGDLASEVLSRSTVFRGGAKKLDALPVGYFSLPPCISLGRAIKRWDFDSFQTPSIAYPWFNRIDFCFCLNLNEMRAHGRARHVCFLSFLLLLYSVFKINVTGKLCS